MESGISHSKLFILLALMLTICTRLYWIPQKAGLHLDESLSIIYSECKCNWAKGIDESTAYVGADIKRKIWSTTSSFADAFSDIKKLQKDNKDSPHTNLYYSILRLCLTGADGQNLRNIIDRGCYLNIFFVLFSFFFLYKLLKRLFDDNTIIAATLIVAFISTASLSNAMFIRPYGLQEMLLILLTYTFACIYQSIEKNKQYNWSHVIPLSVVISFVLLSGYLAIFYVMLLTGVLTVSTWIKSQKKNSILLIISFILSLLLANIIYQKYLNGFSNKNYRAAEAYNKLSGCIFCNLLKSTGKTFEFILTYLLLPFFAIYLPLFRKVCFKNFTKNDRIAIIILVCGIFWSIATMFVVPYKDLRYIMSVFPMLTLIIPLFISKIHKINVKNAVITIIILAYTAIALNPVNSNEHLIKQRIRYLYRNEGDKYAFNRKPEIPVLISCNDYLWRIAQAVAFFNDSQKYLIVSNYDSLAKQLSMYNRAFIIVNNLPEAQSEFKVPDGYKIIKFPNFNFNDDYSLIANYEVVKK